MTGAEGFDLRTIAADPGPLPCVVRGPEAGPRLLFVQPLFEEMNRCRRLFALTGARLAAAGVQSWLVDLPGTGEAAGEATVAAWRAGVAAAVAAIDPAGVVALRGGALIAGTGRPRLLVAPAETGAGLLRDLMRAQAITDREAGRDADPRAAWAAGAAADLAGYPVTATLAADLEALTLDRSGATIVAADELPGPPVWRQAEPAPPHALAAAVSDKVLAWLPR